MTLLLQAFTLMISLAAATLFAPVEDPTLGGFLCARPPTPACATSLTAKAPGAELAACRDELERFATATAAYRDCLGGQMGDAMRHANEVLNHFRCVLNPKACSKSKTSP